MEFKDIEKKVVETAKDYGEKYNIKMDEDFAILKFQEEFGEFIKSYVIHKKKCRPEKYLSEEKSKEELSKELADVVGSAMFSAHLLGIDLEDAINKKWINRQ